MTRDDLIEQIGADVERLMRNRFTPWAEDPEGFWYSASREFASRYVAAVESAQPFDQASTDNKFSEEATVWWQA